MNKYEVSANGTIFGIYEADCQEEAMYLCAQEAGYESIEDMERHLGSGIELDAARVE